MHITKKYIHINSRFRDKLTEDACNFLYTLPFFIENVVAIRLNSIEMMPGGGLPDLNAAKYFFFCLDDYTNHEIDKHIVCLAGNMVLNEKVLGKVQIYDTDNAKIISSDFDGKENVMERLYQNRSNLQRFRVKLINEDGEALKVNGNDLNDFSFTLEVDVIDGI